jgi:hypothetical protein
MGLFCRPEVVYIGDVGLTDGFQQTVVVLL